MSGLKQRWQALSPKRRKMIKRSAGLAVGALGGFTYYATVGCSTGSCPITSSPVISTLWGGLIGLSATY